ncbi:tRNA selenocysteine 1-associated protein 1-like [Pollicipes pollicipes]|uniref:tRNA selenocysteine 1-associated protein 1-like n=1 Tax=Pollicipes pollicipes TaxID=41117 RepID=UPI0018849210|nr:tRNA selenocysteine 1-associated protein 1-like [Pollicipes pollicipes]
MGNIADYMDETFVTNAFLAMDEEVSLVKIIKNKFTGLPAGYCFVHFKDEQTAMRVMHKLNSKMIPNSQPPTRFLLNHSNAKKTQDSEFSLWVGDLDQAVDDEMLYKAFATRYNSVRLAKVVFDKVTGLSRCYAFVRFGVEEDHKDALTHMNGFTGLGSKPIRVSLAVPRRPAAATSTNTAYAASAATPDASARDYSAYYEQYWNNYHAWQNYGSYDPNVAYHAYSYNTEAIAAPAVAMATAGVVAHAGPPAQAASAAPAGAADAADTADSEAEDEVVEHDVPVDVDSENKKFVTRNEEFWDALEASRWLQPDTLNPELSLVIKT